MKMSDNYVSQDIEETMYLIPLRPEDLVGVVRCNPTAAFISHMLKEDTSKEEILSAMRTKYNAPAEEIEADLEEVLEMLRKINALVE